MYNREDNVKETPSFWKSSQEISHWTNSDLLEYFIQMFQKRNIIFNETDQNMDFEMNNSGLSKIIFTRTRSFSLSDNEDEFDNSFILTETAWDAKSSSSVQKQHVKFSASTGLNRKNTFNQDEKGRHWKDEIWKQLTQENNLHPNKSIMRQYTQASFLSGFLTNNSN